MKKFLSILFRKTSHKPSAEGNSAKTTKTKINVPSDIMHRELENKSLLTFHESEIASKARVFFNLVFGTASILTITQTIVCFIIPQNLIRWVTIIIIFNIACAGLLYLNKKKNTSVASFIFIGFLLFFIFGLAWTAGGIKSQAIQAIPLVILVAGLLLGWKVGLLSGLISILGGLGLILAEYQGILPINTVIHSSLSSWINLVMLVSLLALLQFLSVSGLDKSLSNARKELSLRIKAEEKLNYSEVLYRSIFENANDAIFIMKEDRFIECNRKTLEIFGCTREQIINNTPYSYSPRHQPDGKLSEEKALVYINESLKGSPQRFEWQHCQYDKTVFDAEVSLNKIESNNEILLQAIVRDVTERKRTEEIIRDKERRIRGVFDLSFGFIGLLSTDGILLEANHTSLDFVGIKPQDVIGKPFWETPWWTHSPEMQQKLKDAIYDSAGGKTVRFEASHKDSNGLLHFVDFSLKPIKDETGKVVLLIPEGRDITEQKLVENVLRESEAKLSAMFESSRDAIGVAKKGTHIFANPSYLKLFGFEKNEQIIGTSILNSIAPSHRQFMLQNVEHRSDGEPAPTFYESRGLKTDGTEFDAEFNVSTYELNGEIYSLANIRDITERKHAERNLKISEEKFSKLFLSSPDAILLAELKSGKIVEVNSGFEKFSGYSRDELLGQLVLDLNMYSAEDRLKFISLLKVHGNFHDVEFKLKNKAGERLLVLASAELIQINEELHTITILHDITERRQAEQKIRESEERFRLILENMPILLNAFDENRNIIDWNKACEETTGYSADEVIGNPKVMGLLYPDPEYQEKVWNTSLDPTNKNNTFDLVAKNGETRTVEWFDTYLHLAIPGWDSWGMGLDITERMKAEKSLLESEERYRLLVENMPIGMVVSQNDVIVYVNSVVMQIMKVQNESDAIGKSIFDFISPEFWVKSKERREKLTESTPVADLAEFKLVGFDNTLVDVETLAVRILFNGSPAILNLLTDITERKLANEKLQESEKRYRDLSDLLPQTVFETDLNGMLTYVNKIGYDQFGYTQADFKNGLSAFNMLIPRDRELAMQNMKAVITGESSSTNEYTALKKDGSTFPVIIKTNAVIHNGIYTGLRGIIFDITEIRQAQETLRKSEEKYSRIVNTANEGIRIVDTDFIITYVNAQMAKMLGYMPDEMLNQPMENFIYNDELPHYNKRVENRMKGLSEGFETRLRKKNGTLVWASAMSTPIVDPDKGFQGSFAMVTDITDRKIAELALKESEERLRKLLNSVTDYIYTVKVEKGKVVDTIHGEGCKTVTGYSTQEFKNDNYLWYKIIHDSDKKTVKDHAESLISNNEEQNIEHRIIHKNGTIRWVRNTPVLRRNPEGTIIGYDGLISDITKEKQLESQILNSVIETEERERMHFSQELHDGIGPLLSATKMYVQWLAMPNANLNHHEILKDIEKLLDESTSTVREISFKLSPHILQNYGLVEAMGAYIEKVKESSNIKIKMNLRNLCRFDEKAETIVYRVLCECINNTLKHAKASEIAINMSCIDNALIVDYSDNGKGFDVNAVMAGHKGIGLLNMQSRLKSINGVMEIISKPHEGTSIKFQIGIYNN